MSARAHPLLTASRIARKLKCSLVLCPRCSRRFYSKLYVKENDIVLLKRRGIEDAKPILTKKLQPTGGINTHQGSIDHASLIGKEIRDVVYTNKGVGYRIHQPTLAEYVTLSPRMVTPIYPADANLIVSLLDIHPSINREDGLEDEPFEIFEAGTGHGALTLHLARAIHGLNMAPPSIATISTPSIASTGELAPENLTAPDSDHTTSANGESSLDLPNLQKGDVLGHDPDTEPVNKVPVGLDHKLVEEAHLEAYLPSRRAVIHTLDISPAFSKHAQNTIRKFRRGVYYHNIDFHVGTIPEYLSSRLATKNEPFLEHTILDLPGPQEHLDVVGQSLKSNGCLIVFCPSITQIVDCIKAMENKRLPFALDSVRELSSGAGVGGREWDVRFVKTRALLKTEAEARNSKKQGGAVSELDTADDVGSPSNTSEDSGWATVCRPKVGGIVTGGGFLALWRRTVESSASKDHRPERVNEVENQPTDVNEPEGQVIEDLKLDEHVVKL